VADNTVDLPIYLWTRSWPNPHNLVPDALVHGVSRR
jgi:hypothetical protein